jgi:DNA mismatch repair protein MutS2
MEHATGWFAVGFERMFERLQHGYRRVLEWALHHRWFVFLSGNMALFAVIFFIIGTFTPATVPAGAGADKVAVGIPGAFSKGMSVKIDGYSQVGTLVEAAKGNSATVQMGPIKITVPISQLTPVAPSASAGLKPRASVGLQKALHATTELHLRHMRAEEALRDLEKFIDDALLAGLPNVRIIHGKGEGILRKVTQEFLRKHSGVAAFRDGEPAEGGSGATVVTFR